MGILIVSAMITTFLSITPYLARLTSERKKKEKIILKKIMKRKNNVSILSIMIMIMLTHNQSHRDVTLWRILHVLSVVIQFKRVWDL